MVYVPRKEAHDNETNQWRLPRSPTGVGQDPEEIFTGIEGITCINPGSVPGYKSKHGDAQSCVRDTTNTVGAHELRQTTKKPFIDFVLVSRPDGTAGQATQQKIKAHVMRHYHYHRKRKQLVKAADSDSLRLNTAAAKPSFRQSEAPHHDHAKLCPALSASTAKIRDFSAPTAASLAQLSEKATPITCSVCGSIRIPSQFDFNITRLPLVKGIAGGTFDSIEALQQVIDHEMHENLLYC